MAELMRTLEASAWEPLQEPVDNKLAAGQFVRMSDRHNTS